MATTKNPRIIALFDVDGTLTPARKVPRSLLCLLQLTLRAAADNQRTIERTNAQDASPVMLARLQQLRKQITTGVVGGSDLVKQKEQLGETGACISK